ncbi:MAG: Rne/Rng family ribonuclease [Terracidiphilus sp.]|jgi:ribonuclease G
MAKEICISSTPHETRLAILEDDQLAEIYYERENEYTLAGSIYNGRVTRVLPGMQSAFVDVGLERDAFLYVTDFMELEDSEETDELEKAASTSANLPPREVRHTGGKEPAQDRGGRPSQKPEQRQEQRQERPARDLQLTVEALPETEVVSLPASGSVSISEQDEAGEEGSGAPGAKRWRGRRRRRGGRGGGEATANQPEPSKAPAAYVEEVKETEPEVAPQIHATSDRPSQPKWGTSTPAPAPRSDRAPSSAPAPFVLPGESLSKYGAPGERPQATDTPKPAVARPESSFKPATLIDAPIRWDGSGLLPGESLSKHRGRQDEEDRLAVQEETEAQDVQTGAPEAGNRAPDAIEEQDFVEEIKESGPETASLPLAASAEEMPAIAPAEDYVVEEEPGEDEEVLEEDEFEETTETAFDADDPELGESKPAFKTWETEEETSEPDASASHNVDPLPPTGFRLFGLGGKKKAAEEAAKSEPKSAAVSSYAPGTGLIEVETIEEEEFDAPRHPHRAKGGDQDLDDFEEETLPNQLRTGDLGEMLQEAHLDHRIQLNFDEKNGDEEGFDEDEAEEPAAGGRPAAGTATQQRPDRNARGRRGRGGMGMPNTQGGQAGQAGRGRGMSRRSMQTSDLPIISDLLKSGQEILVQIAKEPIAKKGARITSHIALPGRFLVFMPTVSHIGVSRKIASEEERQRLKRILVHERGEASGGFIVRTAAEGASEEELRTDLRMLLNLWAEIKKRSDESKSPALIYHDLGLIERILRDQISSNFSSIWVDSEADYERIVRFLNRFSPTLVRRVKLYTKETPLFEHFGIQDEITKALNSKVWLKSGGSIVINQTEALVAIDINTGKYVGKSARLEDTIVKTNLDAVPEIVRQIRLRDLGGIIVIDFIDMDDRKNRYKVMAALEEALKSDRAPTKVLQFNDFGLVAITRKRVKQSLERTLSVPCPTCQATGMVKSPTTVCNEIYTELRKMTKHFESADVLLRVNPETVKVLKANSGSWLVEFEELTGKNILIKSDPTLHPEQFDIQG